MKFLHTTYRKRLKPMANQNHIDYSLIWKSLNATLSEIEQKELDDWLQEDESHRMYYEKYKNERPQIFTSEEINSQLAWQNIKLTPKRKKHYHWQLGTAICLLIIVASYFGYKILTPGSSELLMAEQIQFEPGIKKATLVLDSGEKLELESKKDTLIEADETLIKNTDSRLNYHAPQKKTNKAKRREQKYNTLIVPRGGEYDLVLADGTKVKINSESILRYPVNFGKKSRNIYLVGEAFFEVATDSLRQFTVTSGNHQVKVYGTSFNVKSYEKDLSIATTLVEGKVAVSNNQPDAQEQILLPGYQSIFHKKNASFEQKKVDIKEYTSWKDGRFYFRNMQLGEMTTILGRWYNVEFVYKNKKAKALRFNGNLQRYDNIENLLNQLQKTNEITFTAYDETIYVN